MRLSERDFASELGRNLLVYPFRNEGVDSSSYSLTASGYAWKLSDKESAMNNDAIVIPAKESVLVVTNETVSLQKYLCGLCCCGVSLATKGAIVNTTPIKCGWIGKLIITIHNPTDNQIKIDSGDKIAVLLVDRLRSSTKKAPQNTNHKTTELLAFQGFSLTDEAIRYINDDNYSDVQNLRDALKGEKSYQEFRKKRRYKNLGYAIAVAVAIVALGFAWRFFDVKEFVPALIVMFVGAVGGVAWKKWKASWE